jgi:hypothetical protein
VILRASILIVLCAFACGSRAGSESYCLEPVEPHPGDWDFRYTAELHKRIEPQLHTFVQMRVMPAFQGEYSVSIHGSPENFYFHEATKCFVSYYAANKNIGQSIPEDNEEKKQLEVSVAAATVDIPLPLAKRIYTVWHKMLLKTRYVENDFNRTPDPTGVEFSSEFRYAQTSNPVPCKSAFLLIQLGERLIDYCKAPPEKRLTATALQVQTAALESFLKHHP